MDKGVTGYLREKRVRGQASQSTSRQDGLSERATSSGCGCRLLEGP